jgi:Tfp pilus assembly protein PilF
MKLEKLLLAGALLALPVGPAAAAVTVLGDTSAVECSHAAFKEIGDLDSLRLCTEAIADPNLDRRDLAGTYVNRGVLYMVRGEFAQARSDFERAITVDASIGEAWVNRGAVDIIDKRYKDGIADIDKGLQLGIEHPAKAYYNRGVADEMVDDETSAYLDYQQAQVLEPNWELPKQELLRFTVTRRDAPSGGATTTGPAGATAPHP